VTDSRVHDLYAGERDSLSFRETLRLLVRSWSFFKPHRRLVLLKTAIAVPALVLFIVLPWPMKIIIDNVIDRRPMTGIPARILTPIAGTIRSASW